MRNLLPTHSLPKFIRFAYIIKIEYIMKQIPLCLD